MKTTASADLHMLVMRDEGDHLVALAYCTECGIRTRVMLGGAKVVYTFAYGRAGMVSCLFALGWEGCKHVEMEKPS